MVLFQHFISAMSLAELGCCNSVLWTGSFKVWKKTQEGFRNESKCFVLGTVRLHTSGLERKHQGLGSCTGEGPGSLIPTEAAFRPEAWIFTDSTCKFYEWLIYFKVVLTDQNICNLLHAATESPCSLSHKFPGKSCVSSGVGLSYCPSHCFSSRDGGTEVAGLTMSSKGKIISEPLASLLKPCSAWWASLCKHFQDDKKLMMIITLQLSLCSCFWPHFV